MHIDGDTNFSLHVPERNLSVTEQGILFFRRTDQDGRGLSTCFVGRDLDTLEEALKIAKERQAQWRASESA